MTSWLNNLFNDLGTPSLEEVNNLKFRNSLIFATSHLSQKIKSTFNIKIESVAFILKLQLP